MAVTDEQSTTKKAKTAANPSTDPDGSTGEWTKVEKRKKKKAGRVEAKVQTTHPRFMYSNTEIVKRSNAIAIDDVRDLVLHLIADAPPPNWLRIDNSNMIQKVVALLVPGLTPDLLSLPPLPTAATSNPNLPLSIPLISPADPASGAASIPFIASTFSHACPTRAPGDQTRMHSVLSSFFTGPVSGEEKKRRIVQRVQSEINKSDPMQYLLTLEQMIENDYPIPSYMADVFEKPQGWVETPEPGAREHKANPRIYAIDCEMVCNPRYFSKRPFTDIYHTNPFSTSKSNGDTVAPTPVLIGHSLKSDLKALKICHPRCIDTALLYHHPRGRPLKPGLAWLIKKCGREIQARGEGGHDPEEDARACVDLLKKKLENGPGFREFKIGYEAIFERMSRSTGRGSGGVKSAVVDHGSPAVMHGAKATTAIGCKTDEEFLEGVLNVLPSHHFVFGRFMSLAHSLGCVTPKASAGQPHPTPLPTAIPESPTPHDLVPILSPLNPHLAAVHAALPPRTALVIFTGQNGP
ncbi:hypothetical protein BDN70DRAFT_929460 [Pholiota conissans]|uniref:Exonuclease domain-containing protein n=1 Tax=Pholiota conissans TaxID=109636 RepID=A0A9P6D454_9AGAR|nr:hypothetical protein BDN70DRAFT_929460 [Pholiota conissans]